MYLKYEMTYSDCLSFKLIVFPKGTLLNLFALQLWVFSVLRTLGHCKENVTPEGDPWHQPEAFVISCQAQGTEVVGCAALFRG